MTRPPARPGASGTGASGSSRSRWRVRPRAEAIRDAVTTQIWPIPTAAVVLAVVVGVLLPRVDDGIDSGLPTGFSAVLFGGGADSARSVLSAIASSLITATSLTFSLTVVALQLASSQASPRLLRMFSRDRVVQATMAVFLATFAYALTVLRTVRSGSEGGEFVPRIAVTIASLLTLASVIMLALFLAHLATRLRVETMLRDVHAETSATLARILADETPRLEAPAPSPTGSVRVALADRSGFLTAVDRARLLRTASEHGVVIAELHRVGTSVVQGVPLARFWADEGRDVDQNAVDAIELEIRRAHPLHYERTSTQDVGFGVRQLVDVACRALSPGINDPTTAVHALGHLSAVLCRLLRTEAPGALVPDDRGRVRIIARTLDASALLALALDQPRHYGAGDARVADRMFQLLAEVAFTTGGRHADCVRSQLGRLADAVDAAGHDEVDLERMRAAARRVEFALAGVWLTEGDEEPALRP